MQTTVNEKIILKCNQAFSLSEKRICGNEVHDLGKGFHA